MKQIASIRKAVCAMANELKMAGHSLSEARLMQVIGGYAYKGNYGCLINIAV